MVIREKEVIVEFFYNKANLKNQCKTTYYLYIKSIIKRKKSIRESIFFALLNYNSIKLLK